MRANENKTSSPARSAARSRQKWLGRCAGVRRLELARRGTCRAGHGGGGRGCGRGAAYSWRPQPGRSLYAEIDTVVADASTTGIERVRPRARRRRRARLARAASAASRGSASPRCCCRRRRTSRNTIGPVLYSSGEESEHQIKSRGERLGVERGAALPARRDLPRAHPRGDRAAAPGAASSSTRSRPCSR